MFARGWAEYLEEKMGQPVWLRESKSKDDLRRLRNYQRNTEGQIA